MLCEGILADSLMPNFRDLESAVLGPSDWEFGALAARQDLGSGSASSGGVGPSPSALPPAPAVPTASSVLASDPIVPGDSEPPFATVCLRDIEGGSRPIEGVGFDAAPLCPSPAPIVAPYPLPGPTLAAAAPLPGPPLFAPGADVTLSQFPIEFGSESSSASFVFGCPQTVISAHPMPFDQGLGMLDAWVPVAAPSALVPVLSPPAPVPVLPTPVPVPVPSTPAPAPSFVPASEPDERDSKRVKFNEAVRLVNMETKENNKRKRRERTLREREKGYYRR